MIAKKYQDILAEVEPFILGNPNVFKNYPKEVLGLKFKDENLLNCLERKNASLFELLQKLDGLTFGHQGMGMDRWVFFDCAAMPSGIFGLGLPKHKLDVKFLNMLEVPETYEGLVPISMYMAIPTSDRGRWFGHNLSSLNKFLGTKRPGLGLLTKALACQVFQIEWCYGATQWGSPAIEIHSQLAPMKLKAAWLSAHSYPNSLCYASDYSEENLKVALSGEKRAALRVDLWLESKDETAQKELQNKIESGETIWLAGRPKKEKGQVFYPIKFES